MSGYFIVTIFIWSIVLFGAWYINQLNKGDTK